MIPRKRIDIGLVDLAFGIASCFVPGDGELQRHRIEDEWDADRANLVCLSVRSGFDALLSVLDFPAGSEIVVSAVTIRDMTRIIEAHGLVAVPVDLDMTRLAVDATVLEREITPRTRAVLIAHLFGSRMPMNDIVGVARARGLMVIEDCAQAYSGDAYRGHAASDVSLFSFGPIKTATALAGAMLGFRDRGLRDRVRACIAGWPVQSRWYYLSRLVKYVLLVLAGNRVIYGAFASLCCACGTDQDRVLANTVRGFAGGDFFHKIRHGPSAPLVALLVRRLRHVDRARIAQRAERARLARELMSQVAVMGAAAEPHSHWVFAIRHSEPERLMRNLWRHGFDATRGASSLYVVSAPPRRAEPVAARDAMAQVLYLPVYAEVSERDVERLAAAVAEFDAAPNARSKATPAGKLTRREGAARFRNAAKR